MKIMVVANPKAPIVLLVEPDDDCYRLLALVFRKHGLSTVRAIRTKDALNLFYHLTPSLVVIELYLPLSEGLALIRATKSVRTPHPAPVLVLTTLTSTSVKEQALAAGCDRFIAKPFHLKPLDVVVSDLLASALSKREMRDISF